jgi:hypothetical protein
LPLAGTAPLALNGAAGGDSLEQARALREQFGQFFGETFFGQMIASMRDTVGKSSYFHGGRAEEVFQAQLDQTLSEEMTAASADQLIGPMFEHAFPDAAALLGRHEKSAAAAESSLKNVPHLSSRAQLSDLEQLRRR